MAKQVKTVIKLQIKGGQANPAPPVGPALGQAGINIMEFCKAYNDQTKDRQGEVIPVEITAFVDSYHEYSYSGSSTCNRRNPALFVAGTELVTISTAPLVSTPSSTTSSELHVPNVMSVVCSVV